jgi:hypothetical protein
MQQTGKQLSAQQSDHNGRSDYDGQHADSLVSAEEAAELCSVPLETLMGQLRAKQVPGAFKAPGQVAGPQPGHWLLPRESVDAILHQNQISNASGKEWADELTSVLSTLKQLMAALSNERRQLHSATSERRQAEAQREEARNEVSRLEAQLEAERARRQYAEKSLGDIADTPQNGGKAR